MSTPALIAQRVGDLYDTIYCHFDGYPEYMHTMLRRNYDTTEKVSELIAYGDASAIKENVVPMFDKHSFDTPEKGCCVFYHRDRGDAWLSCAPVLYTRKNLFKRDLNSVDYIYVFENGSWSAFYCGTKIC